METPTHTTHAKRSTSAIQREAIDKAIALILITDPCDVQKLLERVLSECAEQLRTTANDLRRGMDRNHAANRIDLIAARLRK